MKARRKLWAWALAVVATFALVLGLSPLAFAAAGNEPVHSKNLKNNGDGTYTLSLDVVGDSEKEPNKVNVIVILDRSGSMDERTGGFWSSTRMDAAKSAVNSLANSLFAYNTSENPDTVEMALVSFSTTGSVSQGPTQTSSEFTSAVNGLRADGGTNWENALQVADGITFTREAPTFAIFVSDGNPTFHSTDGGYGDWNRQYGVYGTGYDTGAGSATNIQRCYDQAIDDAESLAAKVGADNFYTIGAYGSVTRMLNLTTDAGAPASNYFSASDTDELESALDTILSKIEMSGIANADITDGTTNKVVTSSGTVSLINVVPNSFKYYRNGEAWADAPEAELVDGEVEWDLSELGVLENGVRYTVTFDVYPSQTALDYAARLDNGEKYNDVVPAEAQQYFGEDGSLATNTIATLAYEDTRTEEGEQTAEYTNPPRVSTNTSTMSVEKKWEGAAAPAGDLKLIVEADGDEFAGVTLNAAGGWKNDVYISYGIIKGGEVLVGAEGHDFSFAELPSVQYRWELDAPTVHPMIIDGTPTMLVKQDADHQAPAGAKTYTINGETYYVDSAITNLTATNYRRSNLNLTKAVDGEGAPENATFPFTLTVDNAKAAGGDAADTSSDYYVWFSINDESGEIVKDATVTGATPEAGDTGYYYAPSGAEIGVELQAGWNLRFTNLPSGSTYTFTEDSTDGFRFIKAENTGEDDSTFKGGETSTGTIEDAGGKAYTVTYTNEYALTEVTATKTWDDADNQDGIRPDELALTLNGLPEGTTAPEPTVVKDGNNWTYTWSELPKYDENSDEIVYTVTEEVVPEGYECDEPTAENGGTITNTHEVELIEIDVEKVWDDADDQDGKRPESVDVQLLANGEACGDPVTLSEDNGWAHTWTELDKFADGEEIEYSVDELEVEDYDVEITGDADTGFTITNSYTPEVTTATVVKVWDDAENQDGKRPAELAVTLLANGQETETTATLNEGNGWTATVENLDKYAEGEEIKYTWTEGELPEGYELTNTSVEGTVTTLTNSYTPELTEATVKKVWDDAENQDGIRPGSLVVTLSNGTEVTLSESNSWTATIKGLPKYAEGELIEYTWTEADVEGYELTSNEAEGTVTTLTNTHEPEVTEATVVKDWDDAENQDGKRPESLTVTLSDGQTVTLDEANGWTATLTDLPKYADGTEIEYTWTEGELPEGYTLAGSAKEGTVTTLTNRHAPELIDIEVEKIWVDGDNQDGIRPESVTVKLLANGEDTGKTVTLDEANGWKDSFTDLPKYAEGEEINYTVEEVVPEGYKDSYDETGYIITNTHTPEVTEASIKKVWDDAENQDGKRPETIVVTLSDGTEVTLSASSNWEATIGGLPKYKAGVEIEYTWTEAAVEGYELTGTVKDGTLTTLTNTHTPEKTEVKVTKEWKDASDQDGIRPDAITVNLLADGEQAGTVELNAGNGWTATFSDLDKYKAGKEIAYTVEEVEVRGYDVTTTGTADDGFTITNTHTPETTEVSVKKVWDDGNNKDGIRPASITVTLLADGKPADRTLELNEANGWAGTFTDLPKNAAGKAIAYTVEELVVKDYEVTVEGDAAAGFTITNFHKPTPTPVLIDPPVDKVISGDKPATAETFTFQMKAITEGAPMPEGSKGGVKTMTITGAGTNEFGEATITEPGTYVYEITEVKGDAKGYTYDTTTYTLTVKVTEGENYTLVKDETITDGAGKEAKRITFTNKYEAPKTPATGDVAPMISQIAGIAALGSALIAAGVVRRRRED